MKSGAGFSSRSFAATDLICRLVAGRPGAGGSLELLVIELVGGGFAVTWA